MRHTMALFGLLGHPHCRRGSEDRGYAEEAEDQEKRREAEKDEEHDLGEIGSAARDAREAEPPQGPQAMGGSDSSSNPLTLLARPPHPNRIRRHSAALQLVRIASAARRDEPAGLTAPASGGRPDA